MKVRILKDLPRTIDGQRIGPFRAGQELEMDDAQAVVFIGSAMAEEVVPQMIAIEAIPDGSETELTGDGSGTALPEIESPRRNRKKSEQ